MRVVRLDSGKVLIRHWGVWYIVGPNGEVEERVQWS